MLSTAEKIIDQARKHTRHLGLKAQIISREIESLEQLAARAENREDHTSQKTFPKWPAQFSCNQSRERADQHENAEN
jgi:hypothetical protein